MPTSTWALAGSLHDHGWPGRLRTRIVALQSGALVVVGSDNICTPGFAWRDSVYTEVSHDGGTTWMDGAQLPRKRDRFVLLGLHDGRAIVIGGTTDDIGDDAKSFRSVFELGPTGSEDWERLADLGAARSAPAGAVMADGRVLIAGGFYSDLPDAPPMRMLDSSEIFDPETGRWSGTGALATARYGAGMVTLTDGRVLIVGGWPDVDGDAPAPNYGLHTPLRSTEVYKPGRGTWAPAGDLPQGAAEPSVVALPDGGALVIVDGKASRLDPVSLRWAPTGTMVGGWTNRTLVGLADGRVLAAGGFRESAAGTDSRLDGFSYTAEAEIYDPTSDAWTAVDPMPMVRAAGTAQLLRDGSVLIVGGEMGVGQPGAPYCPLAGVETVRFRE